jgi:hypothetical protein
LANRKLPRADAHGIGQLQIVVEGDPAREYANQQGEQQNKYAKHELDRRLASLVAGAKAGADTVTQGASSGTDSW